MISVCLACYNGSRFIVQQLESILTQLGADDEVIVSDDNSSDQTIVAIEAINDPRIKLIKNESTLGVISNFEIALSYAKYDLIFLSDQDDVWDNRKVKVMLDALMHADLVVSNCCFIDEYNVKAEVSFFERYSSGKGFLKNFIKNTYLGNCMAFNRKVLDAALPFPPELHRASKYKVYHDVWIGLLANALYRVQFLPEELSSFRRHNKNASPTNDDAKSSNPISHKIYARYLLITSLLLRLVKTMFAEKRKL